MTYKVCKLNGHQNSGIHFVGECAKYAKPRRVVASYKGNKVGLMEFLSILGTKPIMGSMVFFISMIVTVTMAGR